MKVARLTLSDRASAGIYEDRSGPEIERVFGEAGFDGVEWRRVVMPDEREEIEALLRQLADVEHHDLILTTGGTGPSRRDVTSPARSRIARCVDMVLAGISSARATPPAGSPSGPARTRRRKTSMRVACARAAKASMATFVSIFRRYWNY